MWLLPCRILLLLFYVAYGQHLSESSLLLLLNCCCYIAFGFTIAKFCFCFFRHYKWLLSWGYLTLLHLHCKRLASWGNPSSADLQWKLHEHCGILLLLFLHAIWVESFRTLLFLFLHCMWLVPCRALILLFLYSMWLAPCRNPYSAAFFKQLFLHWTLLTY